MKIIKSLTIASIAVCLALGFTANIFAQQANGNITLSFFNGSSKPSTGYCFTLVQLHATPPGSSTPINLLDKPQLKPPVALNAHDNFVNITLPTAALAPNTVIQMIVQYVKGTCEGAPLPTLYWGSFKIDPKYDSYQILLNNAYFTKPPQQDACGPYWVEGKHDGGSTQLPIYPCKTS